MNTEFKQILLTNLVKKALIPWYENRWLKRSEKANIESSIETMYGIVGQVITHLSKVSKDPDSVVATLEGSIAEMASIQLKPKVQAKVRHDILHNTNMIDSNDPASVAMVDFLPDVHTLDSDIILQQFDVDTAWEIINNQQLIFGSGEVKHLALPKHYKVYINNITLDNGCKLIVLQLRYKNQVIHHIDFSRNPTEPDAQNRDNRTDRSGDSLHDIIKHPLESSENGDLIIKENRRSQYLDDPEHARSVSNDKTSEAATEISIRDMRKSVAAITSRNFSKTPIAELSNKGKFITQNLIDKIRTITPEIFNNLDDYFKTSWLKEIMIIATLDPFLALWWLHTTGLDASIMGIHYENLGDSTKQLAKHLSGIKDVEQSRKEYSETGRGDGWQIVSNIYKRKINKMITPSLAPPPQTVAFFQKLSHSKLSSPIVDPLR
jgi:hypothetical protein